MFRGRFGEYIVITLLKRLLQSLCAIRDDPKFNMGDRA